jgi:tRNA (cytidine/uridine-2'-O-)-methyltransferase
MGSNHIVLYEPEIPQNAGNIMRTCAGTDTILHLIRPLGFRLDEVHLKRAAVNYLEHVKYFVYDSWDDFLSKNKGEIYFLTRYGLKTPFDFKLDDLEKDYYFIIGKESTGIPKAILQENIDRCIRLPMNDHIRALNISNVAAVCIFEALRQQHYRGLSLYEPETLKGKDFLLK